MVAGWTMLLSLNVFDAENWCDIPFDNYDFENGTPPETGCGDLTTTYNVYVNGVLEDTFTQNTTEDNIINITLN
jgi:hypothetical protein